MGVTLYKVLVNGKSCNGGDMAWSLPVGDKPGEWHEVDGPLSICKRGLHLTHTPEVWWKDGASLYEAEYSGEVIGDPLRDDKVVVSRARLIRSLSAADYAERIGVRVLRGGVSIESGYGHGIASSGSGYGSGYVDGSGHGYGYGHGAVSSGYGYGYGYMDGSGHGNGDGEDLVRRGHDEAT